MENEIADRNITQEARAAVTTPELVPDPSACVSPERGNSCTIVILDATVDLTS